MLEEQGGDQAKEPEKGTTKVFIDKQPTINLPDNVTISDCSFLFYQESDSCQENTVGQELTVRTEDAGGGKFIIIKTERWAMDSNEIDKFASMLKQIVYLAENSKVKE